MTRLPDAPLLFDPARSLPSPSYAEHYGFARAPFDSTSDARFVYPGRAYASVQAQILEALKRREGLVVLTGGSGTGKTTLYRSLLHALPPPIYVSEVVDPFLTPEDLLKQILIDFGMPSEAVGSDTNAGVSYHDLVLTVRRFLEGLHSASARVIIIIDDAHQLQPRVLAQLRALANIQTGTGKGLQILLVGQPGLDLLLVHPDVGQLNERVLRRCHLPPLTRDEVLPYIRHRLAAAAGDVPRSAGADTLNPTGGDQPAVTVAAPPDLSIGRPSLKRLVSLSGGIPRTLNLLCDRALEIAFERRTYDISPDIVRESAKRVGLRVSLVDRLHTRTAALVLAITILSVLAAGLWAIRPFKTRTHTVAAPIPALGEPARPAVIAGPVPSVEPLQTSDSFAIVVASFKSGERAQDTVTALTQLDLPAFAREDGGWHVVLVGPYVTSNEAADALRQIPQKEYPDARVQRQAVAQISTQ